ncbi:MULTISPECIES: hypothetical protein [Fusobacterium]|jgi:hypothetical protein|uniref:Tail connector protein n=1 Tax=Myoviridae sp. ctSyg22 TaxID=2823545 RepID=A0A8S5L916_9CAUD|nr:hypothetical protein FNCP10_10770 [Fusobacterium nucleatum]BEP07981.1 hypothetical protein FNSP10_13550 [Fusobacterium nucleatum]DAD66428.1 MAG TPA: tail connector protein [Myoviridae sp. ctSyg22]
MEDFKRRVLEKLKLFKIDEAISAEYFLQKALSSINNFTNQSYSFENIPEGLKFILVDKAVGEILNFKKLNGELKNFDFSSVLKSIKEGDTTETYSDTVRTPEELFEFMVMNLLTGSDKELYRYRRLQW